MDHVTVTAPEFAALPGLDEWRWVLGGLEATYAAGSWEEAVALTSLVAAAADASDHHPDVDLRYPDRVHVRLVTHDAGTVTTRDVDLARVVSTLAEGTEATAVPGAVQAVEFAIDTMDADRIRPFWAAVLDYRDVGGILVDPRRQGPPLWFQPMAEPRTERSRFHVDVSVPHDVAEARIAAAVAAGGRIVDDTHARSWWVLADADGNEACVCTWQDR